MNLSVIKYQDKWLIAENYCYRDTGGTTGSIDRAPMGRYGYDRCWDDREKWACTNHFARKFDSKGEAEQYLDENYEMMCSAPNSF